MGEKQVYCVWEVGCATTEKTLTPWVTHSPCLVGGLFSSVEVIGFETLLEEFMSPYVC